MGSHRVRVCQLKGEEMVSDSPGTIGNPIAICILVYINDRGIYVGPFVGNVKKQKIMFEY